MKPPVSRRPRTLVGKKDRFSKSEIFGIGLPEILVVAIVALIVLGPDRLPEAARTLGKAVADFRRAIEPARTAWSDVTREFSVSMEQTQTSAPAPRSGNPWEVHPLAEGLSDEERERFFTTGEIPLWKREQLEKGVPVFTNGNGASPESLAELDYPMPHDPLLEARAAALEELDYPEPPGISKAEAPGQATSESAAPAGDPDNDRN